MVTRSFILSLTNDQLDKSEYIRFKDVSDLQKDIIFSNFVFDHYNVRMGVPLLRRVRKNFLKFENQLTFKKNDIRSILINRFFNQNELMADKSISKGLKKIVQKYNGLCELVCNQILLDDLLDTKHKSIFKRRINIASLDKIKKTHMLNIYSVFQKVIAFLFGIYANNIISCRDQWKLVKNKNNKKKINLEILQKGLNEVANDEILKVQVFKKKGLNFSGHAVLIKKIDNDKYTFFDPNIGEITNLSFIDIKKKLNILLINFQATDIFISTKTSFLNMLKNKKIIVI